MNVVGAGSTLRLADSHDPSSYHHWLVLCDPFGKPQQVIIVMCVTLKAFSDDTVVLVAGDHPFVKRDTSVNYSTAYCCPLAYIIKQMHHNRCTLRETLSDSVLTRVREGMLRSPRTVVAIREIFARHA